MSREDTNVMVSEPNVFHEMNKFPNIGRESEIYREYLYMSVGVMRD